MRGKSKLKKQGQLAFLASNDLLLESVALLLAEGGYDDHFVKRAEETFYNLTGQKIKGRDLKQIKRRHKLLQTSENDFITALQMDNSLTQSPEQTLKKHAFRSRHQRVCKRIVSDIFFIRAWAIEHPKPRKLPEPKSPIHALLQQERAEFAKKKAELSTSVKELKRQNKKLEAEIKMYKERPRVKWRSK